MKHPESFLVPAFMLADYFLTLVGAKQRGGTYSEHFVSEHYEMNPIWQKSVARAKWFNPKHLLLTVAVTLFLLLVTEGGDTPEPIAQGVFGVFGSVIGRHLCNLLTFRLINGTPDEISGKVTMTHAMTLSVSLYQYVVVLVPMALVAAFSRTPFVIGAVLGVIVLVAAHLMWIAKYRRQRNRLEESEAGGRG